MKKTPTLFLIDDDEDDRELFQYALQETGLKTNYASASSCSDALGILKAGEVEPDMIFLDLNMPQMNGKTCLMELKKNAALMHIPVYIFSTSSDPNDISETKAMGAKDFITKPSKITELTRILKDLTTHFTINLMQ